MEADGAEAKHQGHSPAFTLLLQKVEPFSNKTGKAPYILTPQSTSINNNQHRSTTTNNINQQQSITSINNNQPYSKSINNNIRCFSFSLLQIASSKTVLTLDFRREALRDAAQMTSLAATPSWMRPDRNGTKTIRLFCILGVCFLF